MTFLPTALQTDTCRSHNPSTLSCLNHFLSYHVLSYPILFLLFLSALCHHHCSINVTHLLRIGPLLSILSFSRSHLCHSHILTVYYTPVQMSHAPFPLFPILPLFHTLILSIPFPHPHILTSSFLLYPYSPILTSLYLPCLPYGHLNITRPRTGTCQGRREWGSNLSQNHWMQTTSQHVTRRPSESLISTTTPVTITISISISVSVSILIVILLSLLSSSQSASLLPPLLCNTSNPPFYHYLCPPPCSCSSPPCLFSSFSLCLSPSLSLSLSLSHLTYYNNGTV